MRKILLIGSLILADLAAAEQVFEELTFSSNVCEKLGYASDFDACAVLEACEGRDDSWHRDLQNFVGEDGEIIVSAPEHDWDNSETLMDQVVEAEVEQKVASHSSPTPNARNARYGWRLAGSTQCSWPGPLIRLQRGMKHGLFVKGSGNGRITAIHFHGLHIAGHGNADDMMRVIKDEDVLIYTLDIPADKHVGGTHLYHSHAPEQSQPQVAGGSFGMLVIDDNGHSVGTEDENVLAFLNNERHLLLDNRANRRWRANGMEMDSYLFNKDEWYRLRILLVNVDAHKIVSMLRFQEGKCEIRAIAHDGIFRFQVPAEQPQSEFILNTASRLDVAIRCSANAEISLNNEPVAKIVVGSSGDLSLTPFESGDERWFSDRLAYVEDLREMSVDNHWQVKLDGIHINGRSWARDKTAFCAHGDKDFAYDSVQEWTIKGADTHPFHLHMYPMQIVEGCGLGHVVGEFYDTILTYGSDKKEVCKVRLWMTDVAGPVAMHCHILTHEDRGVMGYVYVSDGPVQPDEPRVQQCTSGDVCDAPKRWVKACEA